MLEKINVIKNYIRKSNYKKIFSKFRTLENVKKDLFYKNEKCGVLISNKLEDTIEIIITENIKELIDLLENIRIKINKANDMLEDSAFLQKLWKTNKLEYFKFRTNDSHLEYFSLLKELFNIPVDRMNHIGLIDMTYLNKPNLYYRLYFTVTTEKHILTNDDVLYHTSENHDLKTINFFIRQAVLYSESRFYVGLNEPMWKYGDMKQIPKKLSIYKIIVPVGTEIFRDPEMKIGGLKYNTYYNGSSYITYNKDIKIIKINEIKE